MSGGATSGGARAGSSGRGVAGGVDTGAATARLPNGGAGVLGRLYAGTLPLHPHTDELTGGVIDYLRTQWGTDHLADPDPHGQYLSAVPSEYLTQSEADGLYLPADYVPPASGISQADADTRYVNTWAAGDTMQGALTVNGNISTFGHLYTAEGNVYATSAGSASVHVSAPAGGYRSVSLETSSSPRWFLTASYEPETGSNAGSNLWLNRMDDAGGFLGTALSLSRATGAATFGGAVTATSVAGGGGTPAAAGAVRLPNGTTGTLAWRNAGNTADLTLGVDGSDRLAYNGSPVVTHALADAKGDLLAASAADALGRLPAGTNGHVLTADSAETLGVKWAAASGGGGSGLPTTGGTMTGPIVSSGADVTAGGALRVQSPATPSESRVIGAASTFSPEPLGGGYGEAGVRFHVTSAASLCLVRWWRQEAGSTAPTRVALWDSTSTGAPVWTQASPSAFTDTALGWKTHPIPVESRPALVVGRSYTVSYTIPGPIGTVMGVVNSYTPTPDAPVVFETNALGAASAYPSDSANNYGIDGGVAWMSAALPPAASGAVRLPNASAGALGWRNAGDTADLSLTMDGSDRLALVVGAGSVTTSATAGAASALPATPTGYLSLSLNGSSVKVPYYS